MGRARHFLTVSPITGVRGASNPAVAPWVALNQTISRDLETLRGSESWMQCWKLDAMLMYLMQSAIAYEKDKIKRKKYMVLRVLHACCCVLDE